MTQEHTPTPYRVEQMDNEYGYAVCAGEKTNYRGVAICTAPDGGSGIKTMTPKAKANAEFIVRACNSHDALVEALQVFLNHPLQLTHSIGLAAETKKARAALKLAGAE